jgi:hemolysin activation/secretion protein
MHILGQYSPEMLVATEKDTVGGLQSIRGFKDYVENADTTIVTRNELIVVLPAFKSQRTSSLFGDISLFTAFDLGRFSNYEEGRRRVGIMSGVAAGVRNTGGYINLSCTIAKPLETPVTGKNSSVVYFSLAIDV